MLSLQICDGFKYARFVKTRETILETLGAKSALIKGVTKEALAQIQDNGLTVGCSDGGAHLMFGKAVILGGSCTAEIIRAKHTNNRSVPESVSKVYLVYRQDQLIFKGVPQELKYITDSSDQRKVLKFGLSTPTKSQINLSFTHNVEYSTALEIASAVGQYIRISSNCMPCELWYLGNDEVLVDRRIIQVHQESPKFNLDLSNLKELCQGNLGVAQAMQDSIRIFDSNVTGELECELLLVQVAKSLDSFVKFCTSTNSLEFLPYRRILKSDGWTAPKVFNMLLSELMPEMSDKLRESISITIQPMRNSYVHSGVQQWLFSIQGGLTCATLREILLKLVKKVAFVVWGARAALFR